MFDPAPLLQVPLLELGPPFSFQMQSRRVQGCVDFSIDLGPINFLALAHNHSLFRTHLYPALGVSLENLSILRRHREETLTGIVESRSMVRHWSHRRALLGMWLRHCRQRAGETANRNGGCAYKV
jgi:hypothetical protein